MKTTEEIKNIINTRLSGIGNQAPWGGALSEVLNALVDIAGQGGDDSVRKITVDAKITELPSDVVGSVENGDILFAQKSGVAIVSFASEDQVTFSKIPTVYGNLEPINYVNENGTWVLDERE